MAYTLWSTGKFNSTSQRTLRSDSMIKKHAGYGRQSGLTAGLRVSHLEFGFSAESSMAQNVDAAVGIASLSSIVQELFQYPA